MAEIATERSKMQEFAIAKIAIDQAVDSMTANSIPPLVQASLLAVALGKQIARGAASREAAEAVASAWTQDIIDVIRGERGNANG